MTEHCDPTDYLTKRTIFGGIHIMKTLISIFFVLIATTVFATPFLVCDAPDPAEGVTHYKLTGWSVTQTPAPLHMDVSSASVGTTNITVAACKSDAVWGEHC